MSLIIRWLQEFFLYIQGLSGGIFQEKLANSPATRAVAKVGKMRLWPLVAATYFMVSGGPFGTEDVVRGAGYLGGIAVLLLTPLLWSLPTALMVGELSSAIPAEGGFYVWVRRALGPFWGFEEAWLSLAASAFDMAIYPTLFVIYLSEIMPALRVGHRGVLVGLLLVATCAAWNILGAKAVGDSSLWLMLILGLGPFVLLSIWAVAHPAPRTYPHLSVTGGGLIAGILVAMWNFMGWDNASTIAGEVDRPQRTYPLAMLLAVMMVALSYAIPVAAMSRYGVAPSDWGTGSWAEFAGTLIGPWLKILIVLGGALSALGMLNSLVMSYTRLPLVMAEDGLLPKLFTRVNARTGAPWVSIVFCAIGWAACLGIGFERLVTLDILLYGGSLILEFAALIALRIREPELTRPFRLPGGSFGAWAIGVVPAVLIGLSVIQGRGEQIAGMSALAFGSILIAAGVLAYPVLRWVSRTFAAPELTQVSTSELAGSSTGADKGAG
jgi:amino acid transporter